jgi:ATP-dependent Clp protease ATP-binding subunit ClpA
MRFVVALAPPAISAVAGAVAVVVVTALSGPPNTPLAAAMFAGLFAGLGIDAVLREARGAARGRRERWVASGSARPMAGGMGPFDRFNDRAKRVLALAQDEAIRFNHNYIGTEHVLLGLIREGEGVAARALDSLGVELSALRRAVELSIGRGEAATAPSEITLSPRTKKVIELAIDEARKLGHSHVGTEHLLLGIVREGEGIASGILPSLGVSLERVRTAVIAAMGAPGTAVAGAARAGARGGPVDRFNDHAKRVLALAQDEAIRLRHNYIGTEHLLLGLVREGDGAGAQALAESGPKLEEARRAIESIIGLGEATASPSEITLTPRTKKVIELANDEASRLGHAQVGSGHILLGLIREGEGVATDVLDAMSVNRDQLRARALEKIAAGLP